MVVFAADGVGGKVGDIADDTGTVAEGIHHLGAVIEARDPIAGPCAGSGDRVELQAGDPRDAVDAMNCDVVERAAVFSFLEIPAGPVAVVEGMLTGEGYGLHGANCPGGDRFSDRAHDAEVAEGQLTAHGKILFFGKALDLSQLGERGADRLVANNMFPCCQGGDCQLAAAPVVIADGDCIAVSLLE